jgi:hypothetical protein
MLLGGAGEVGGPDAGTALRQMISLPRSTAVENTWFSR